MDRPAKKLWLKKKQEEKEAHKKLRALHKKESKAENWAKQKGMRGTGEGGNWREDNRGMASYY